MATRWDDPANWLYADWSDATKQPLISHLWGSLKAAADERACMVENVHDTSIPASKEFPDLNNDKSAILFGVNTPNNATRIKNSIYPFSCVKTDSISTSGTVSASDIPENLTLAQLLTGPLSYASGTLLHMTESSSGADNALFQMEWIKQWFKVMDYPRYYNKLILVDSLPLGVTELPEITNVERQTLEIDLSYTYSVATTTFTNASCIATYTDGSTSDLYVANDLNESSPFSTVTECRDYAIDKYDEEITDATNWAAVSNSQPNLQIISSKINFQTFYQDISSPDQSITIRVRLENKRVRVKFADAFRPTSPDRFTAVIKINYWKEIIGSIICGNTPYTTNNTCASSYNDFGDGHTEDEITFVTVSKNVDGWWYIENTPDFTTPTVPSLSAEGENDHNLYSNVLKFMTADMPNLTTYVPSVYFDMNTTDGNNFEFYTP